MQAKQLGGHVRKGEKPAPCIAQGRAQSGYTQAHDQLYQQKGRDNEVSPRSELSDPDQLSAMVADAAICTP
jgi:antirestriction protein ArdC